VALRNEGHDVVHVRDRSMTSAGDAEVLARAFAEDRVVVTFNVEDFEALARACQVHGGLILLPSGSLTRAQQLALVKTAWSLVMAEHDAGRDMGFEALPTR
jgi:predicted nuclease of predicted toxin-antitoxin system